MRKINFNILSENASTNVVNNTKVSAEFAQALKEAFLMLQNINAEINKKINSQLKIYFSTR